MNEKELVIVLKTFPHDDHKFCVISKFHGKIEIVTSYQPRFQRISPGTLLACSLQKKTHKVWKTKHIEIVLYPMCRTAEQLYFIHNVLEMYYYFIPLHIPCIDVFAHLYRTLKVLAQEQLMGQYFPFVERIVILKFLILIGFYPEMKLVKYAQLFDTVIGPYVDLSQEEKVRFEEQTFGELSKVPIKAIDTWISSCIQDHPCKNLFKTASFLRL